MTEKQVESKALAVRQQFGQKRAALLVELADSAFEAARVAEEVVARSLSSNVDKGTQQTIFMAEGQAAAREIRENAKAAYLESELQEKVALDEIAKEARQILTPNVIDPAAVISAAQLQESQIIEAADSIAFAGEAAHDTLLTLLSSAMERGLEGAIHHIAELNDEWASALLDLSICAEAPEFDEAKIEADFETYAKATPDGPAILAARDSAQNTVAKLSA